MPLEMTLEKSKKWWWNWKNLKLKKVWIIIFKRNKTKYCSRKVSLIIQIAFLVQARPETNPTLKTWKPEPLPVLKTWKPSPYQPKNEINFDDDEDYDEDYEDEIDSSALSPLGIDPPVNIFFDFLCEIALFIRNDLW